MQTGEVIRSNSAWSSLIACVNALVRGAETGAIVVAAGAVIAEAFVAAVVVVVAVTAEGGNHAAVSRRCNIPAPIHRIHRTNFKPGSCGLPPANLNVISLADAIDSWPTSAL